MGPNPIPNPMARAYYRVRFHTTGYAQTTGYVQTTGYTSLVVYLLGSTELSRSTDPGQGLRPTEPTRRLPTLLS
jgi:hypothetical protein